MRTPLEVEAHRLLLDRLRRRGDEVTTITWDRGLSFLDLTAYGPVHDIEDINRWRLPQWLARAGLRPVARALRQGRVRGWWRRLGDPDGVLVLGPLRPEMVHYVPPGTRPAALLLAGRDLELAESLEATLDLVDRTVALDATALERVRVDDPTVIALGELLGTAPPGSRNDREDLLVVGAGPGDWRGAPDLFLRVAAALPETVDEQAVTFAWIGLDPDDGRSYPYHYDAAHLGLHDRIRWHHDPGAVMAALDRASALLLTGRSDQGAELHPVVDAVGLGRFAAALGLPTVAFDTPVTALAEGAEPCLVPYPDVPALAEAVPALLRGPTPAGLDPALDLVLDHLLAAAAP